MEYPPGRSICSPSTGTASEGGSDVEEGDYDVDPVDFIVASCLQML